MSWAACRRIDCNAVSDPSASKYSEAASQMVGSGHADGPLALQVGELRSAANDSTGVKQSGCLFDTAGVEYRSGYCCDLVSVARRST